MFSATVQLSTFVISAFVLGDGHLQTAEVPLQEIVEKAGRDGFAAKPVRMFKLEQIIEAHRLMDSGTAGGKLVVEV